MVKSSLAVGAVIGELQLLPLGAVEDDIQHLLGQEGDGDETSTSNNSSTSSNSTSGDQSYVDSAPASSVPMSGSQIQGTADSLINKYDTELVELITKDLDDVKDRILTKIINASYIHILKNSDIILNTIIQSLPNTIQANPNIRDLFPILLVQSMLASYEIIQQVIIDTYSEMVQEAKNEKKPVPEFEPQNQTFVNNFIIGLDKKLEDVINND